MGVRAPQPSSKVSAVVTWHYATLTVRYTSPSSNDDVYKLVSTTVGNDVRPPCSATIGASRRAVGHPQRIIPSRYIERHCPKQSRRLSLNGWRYVNRETEYARLVYTPLVPSRRCCKKSQKRKITRLWSWRFSGQYLASTLCMGPGYCWSFRCVRRILMGI